MPRQGCLPAKLYIHNHTCTYVWTGLMLKISTTRRKASISRLHCTVHASRETSPIFRSVQNFLETPCTLVLLNLHPTAMQRWTPCCLGIRGRALQSSVRTSHFSEQYATRHNTRSQHLINFYNTMQFNTSSTLET